jgi:anthranilate synthase component 1
VISHVRLDGNLEASYAQAIEKIDNLVNRLSKPLVPPSEDQGHPSTSTPEVFSNLTQKEYEKIVIRAKEYIVAGDIIQVVPARRLSQPTSANPFMIYRTMRTINPSPYMYYLHLEDFHIIGASPEALVRVEDGIVYNFPLAGTYRRGATPEEDEALAIALRADEKERAEHIMLVDLGRNDVGRVAEPGSVQVTDLMRVVRYSHVMHMESEIQGKLHSNSTMYDALRSCLPAGTLSGAPKIRAMEIIAELEREKRGPYGGAVGYFGFQGNMDTAIPIRTIVLKDQIAHVHSGGGVVYDSVPSLEFQETTNKAMAPLQAINKAEGRE